MSILKKDPSTPPVDEGCFLVTVHNVKVADFVNDAELQEHTCYIHLPESLYPVEYKLYRSPKNMLEVGNYSLTVTPMLRGGKLSANFKYNKIS